MAWKAATMEELPGEPDDITRFTAKTIAARNARAGGWGFIAVFTLAVSAGVALCMAWLYWERRKDPRKIDRAAQVGLQQPLAVVPPGGSGGSQASSADAPPGQRATPRSARRALVIGGVAIVMCAALVTVIVMRSSSSPAASPAANQLPVNQLTGSSNLTGMRLLPDCCA